MNPIIENNVVYVPKRATMKGSPILGDGYVPLLDVSEEEQIQWRNYMDSIGMSHDFELKEETLDKQASLGAAVAARERGLVPQSGDWEHPYRWVTPEEVEEIEAPEIDFIVSEDGDKYAFGGGITGPIDLTEKISTVDFFGDERETVGGIWGGEMPRYWYHRPPQKEAGGAQDGGIKAYPPTYKQYSPKIPPDIRQEDPDIVWVSPEPWGKKSESSITAERLQGIDSIGKVTRVIDITKVDPNNVYSLDGVRSQILGNIPIEAIVDPKRATDKSSSYEMPKYDMSWEALIQSKDGGGGQRFKDIEIKPIPDGWHDSEMLGAAGMIDTDNFVLIISLSETYFGETEEDVKSKMVKEYTAPDGKYVHNYAPPRLTPKPDWATDESDPFPEIPSDIKEIHYDDIPEFYGKHNYGDALQQFSSLKGISRKISEIAGMHSEPFYEALECIDGELDYEHAAGAFSVELDEHVTEKQAKLALNRLRDMTQKSLENRGLPEKFYVFRGGKVHDNDKPMPTSLNIGTAAKSYFSQKVGEPYVAMYEVNRDDVLLDMNSMKSEAQGEEELIILGRNLKNPRMVRLPNKDITNPEFHKSKSLDKQAVATSEPPDLSVAARMKARGLEWKKETHRWVRPEDIEEEQPIHELNGHLGSDREAYLEAIIEHQREGFFVRPNPELSSDQRRFIDKVVESFDNRTTDIFRDFEASETPESKDSLRQRADKVLNRHWNQNSIEDMLKQAMFDANLDIPYDKRFTEKDVEWLANSILTPYMIGQLSLLGNDLSNRIREADDFIVTAPESGFGLIHGTIQLFSGRRSSDIASSYIDGVLDIDDIYAPYEKIAKDLEAKLSSLQYFLDEGDITPDRFDKTLQFARDNLFKLIKRGDRVSSTSLASKLYELSSRQQQAFMREALLNSFKDEELVSQIHADFVGNATSVDTQDVIAGISHLTLAIYEDMLKNGDIDDLAKFFSDENIPTGLFHKYEYEAMPFYFLSEHTSVAEFNSHVDTFLSGGEILRKAGIEALSYIDPSHPSLLAMVDSEENPDVMNILAKYLPVTALIDLRENVFNKVESIDIDERFQEAIESYHEKYEYDEWKSREYANRVISLDKRAKSVFDNARRNAMTRLEVMRDAGMELESIESFHALFKEQDEDKSHFLMGHWANNISDEFAKIIETGFSDDYHKPGLPKVFDELYYGTPFGKMHTLSKGAWEGSSSSGWGGALKESVGRQFDDKVIYHSDRRTRESIDEVLEREREMLFKPDDIRSANFSQESLDKYVRMHKSLTRGLLDIAVPDSDTIEVFRGTSDNELTDDQYHVLTSDFSEAQILANSLSSYSLNEVTATDHFAENKDNGIVINIPELHKDNIWSTFLAHSYEGGEREILVINHSDMDAYAKSVNELANIDIDQFIPEYIDIDSIEDLYGTGESANEYVESYSNVENLVEYLANSFESGGAASDLQDYMDSPYYDSSQLSEWINDAAQQLMERAKENYDYLENIDWEQENALYEIVDMGVMRYLLPSGRIYEPDDILNHFNTKSDLSQAVFDVLNEEEDRPDWGVDEKKAQAEEQAGYVWDWAEEGERKVSGI